MKIKLLFLLFLFVSLFSSVFAQAVKHTYRFYKVLDVAMPECGPTLVPSKALGNCPAAAEDGAFVNDVLPCGVQRVVYQNNLNWGLMYPNSEGAITDNYTIQIYLKPTQWSPNWTRIIDFSDGKLDQGIYFKATGGEADRCLDFYPNGIVGACPFFNLNTYYLMTFTRNASTKIVDVYVDNVLFASYNDNDGIYVGKAGTPIYIFRDDQTKQCESGKANFAYMSFTDQFYSKTDVERTFNEICFTANINPNADFAIVPLAICRADQNVEIKYTGTIPVPGNGFTFKWDFDDAQVISGSGMGPFTIKWADTGKKEVTLSITNNQCGNEIVNRKQVTVSHLSLTTALEPGTCDAGSQGTLTVSAKGGTAPYQYSVDSVNYQASEIFKLVPADYKVFFKDADGCVINEPVKIEFSSNLKVQTIADTTICSGESVQLFTTTNAQTFAWEPQVSLDDPSAKDPLASPAGDTQYVVNAILGVCNLRDTVNVRVNPPVQVSVTPDAIIDYNVPFQLTASSPQVTNLNGATFAWSPPVGLNNAAIPSPIATLQEDQTYIIAITSEMGCVGEGLVNLRVRRREKLNVPTAFSPNGDGNNEVLIPVVNEISSLTYFKVYNRWGQLVFHTTELNRGWDGTFKGNPVVSGAYVWAIEGVASDGKTMKKTGSVLLLK